MTEGTTPEPQLNRAGRRAQARGTRLRKTGAVMAAIPAAFGTTAMVIGATSGTAGAAATTFTVNSLGDAGDNTCDPSPGECTLRDAILEANANPGDDTIVFEAGLTGTITLDPTELPITESVDIQGPGADVITVSGDDNTRIFNINGPSNVDRLEVVISGLTLTQGSSGFGSAILFDDANLTVRGSVLTANTSTGGGGAIGTDDSDEDLVIDNTTITGNSAGDDGGGVYFYSADGGTFTMTDSTVSGNTADGDGGGLWIKGEADNLMGAVSITGSTITGNDASDGYGGGAFIYYTSGVTITDTTISGNTARAGGGAQIEYVDGAVEITGSTITGNVANYNDGGGLYFADLLGNLSITNTEISGNSAESGGGGVYVSYVGGNLTITGSTITGNSAGSDGGGLYLNQVVGDTTITDTTIAGNTADDDGGGLSWYENGRLVIRNSTVSGNSAGENGGGLYIPSSNYGPIEIYNSTISGNTAGNEGGGIAFNAYYGLTIVQSTVAANVATTVGGIYMGANEDRATVAAAKDGERADEEAAHQAAKATEAQAKGKDVGAHQTRERRVRGEARAAEANPDALTLSGTIVAMNSGADIGTSGTVTAASSLFGTISGTTLVDQGGNLQGVDPLLGALQDNGGPTQTHALLDGSPAINTGPDPLTPFPGSDYDQRGPGYARVIAGRVDIGAFEAQPSNIEPTFTG